MISWFQFSCASDSTFFPYLTRAQDTAQDRSVSRERTALFSGLSISLLRRPQSVSAWAYDHILVNDTHPSRSLCMPAYDCYEGHVFV
ncbi:unnamed protein product [Alternaria burnsii]|nr:unnamed protein product [Alternaria burnsii]